jgi:hypothetical protein
LPDDQTLVLMKRDVDKEKLKIEFEVAYKNIIEMHVAGEKKQFTIAASDMLEIKYVRNVTDYQNYIIAKWKKL